LLVASATCSLGQTAPVSPAAAATVPAEPAAAPDKLLLKVGVNAGRAFRWGSYEGWISRVPVSAAAEYALSSKFTVYTQLDADISLRRRVSYYGERSNLLASGAVGVGGRYYYNQAGRARNNRAHGPFIGNYLAVEAHTEVRRLYNQTAEFGPSINLLWGMQRRINRSLLFDLNAGIGLGANRSDAVLGTPGSTTITTQLNASLYFGR
jgi:hypothetical protein